MVRPSASVVGTSVTSVSTGVISVGTRSSEDVGEADVGVGVGVDVGVVEDVVVGGGGGRGGASVGGGSGHESNKVKSGLQLKQGRGRIRSLYNRVTGHVDEPSVISTPNQFPTVPAPDPQPSRYHLNPEHNAPQNLINTKKSALTTQRAHKRHSQRLTPRPKESSA